MSEIGANDIRVGLIGGSGLGAALSGQTEGKRHEIDTPYGRTSDTIVETEWSGLPVFFLSRHGPGHTLNPSQIRYRANIFALKKLGVTHVLASGAVGSLRDTYKPRDLVVVDQVIDKTHKRANTFYDHAAVHVEFAEPFCPVLRRMLNSVGSVQSAVGREDAERVRTSSVGASAVPTAHCPLSTNYVVHDSGCYVCMEGPAFSTRAESVMHRLWGGGVIGMTAMPEAKLAKEAEIAYALVALVTDYDCWKEPAPDASHDPAVLLREIIGNLEAATNNAIDLLRKTVRRMSQHREELSRSPALSALQLAIWSDKAKIPSTEVERLAPLWGKSFQTGAV